MGTEFQFFKMKGDLQLDGGDGCTTMWMYLTPLNCALNVVNLANFMCVLSQMKKRIFSKVSLSGKTGRTF